MLPAPPALSQADREWKWNGLFWIVKHGMKDEVWAVVAFLRKLPQLNAKTCQELALAAVRLAELGTSPPVSELAPHHVEGPAL
jgi:hypothetical protein